MKKQDFNTVVIRTPRYPLNGLLEIPDDFEHCCRFLESWLKKQEIRNALTIASAGLVERADKGLASKNPGERRKMMNTLLKYYIRMHARATPFGAFAGVSTGYISETTNLVPADNGMDVLKARVDFSVLCDISEYVLSTISDYSSIKFNKNPTIAKYGDKIHCIVHYKANNQKMYRLNVVEYQDYLEFLFDKESTISFEHIKRITKKFIAQATYADIHEFIQSLLNEQLLYCDTDVPVVSNDSSKSYATKIENTHSLLSEDLKKINSLLESYSNIGHDIQGITNSTRQMLDNYKIRTNNHKTLRVDTYRTLLKNEVSNNVKDNLRLALLIVNQWHKKNKNNLATIFNEKFEGKCIPLLHVLDDELGIQFSSEGGYHSALLSGLKFGTQIKTDRSFDSIVSEKAGLKNFFANKKVELSSTEMMQRPYQELIAELPASFAVSATLYKDGDGSDIIHLHSAHSCSAANLISRFSYMNESLNDIVTDIIDAEEKQFPDIIFAEVVHVPSPAHGNVASRSPLRSHEIVFFSESASQTERITLNDLWVYCENNYVKLWSKRLNKQVVPRLTSAHNFGFQSLGIYEFLCSLQLQYNSTPSISMNFGFNTKEYSPRVSIDNVIISPASWRLERKLLESLFDKNNLVQENWDKLVENYKLEHWVQYSVSDNSLQICLTNFVLWQLLMKETEGKHEIVLSESLNMKYASQVSNADGEFANEIIIPYLNHNSSDQISTVTPPNLENRKDKFIPGDQWLSLKLYGSPAICESILLDKIYPFVIDRLHPNELDNFFYIRYIDSSFHLRLRFSAAAEHLSKIFLMFIDVLEPDLQSGILNKVEYFTYDRETERYGGPDCIHICEQIFSLESRHVLEMLRYFEGKSDDFRWRAALKLVDATLSTFGYSIEQKLRIASKGRTNFGQEFGDNLYMRNQLGKKYRSHKSYIESDFFSSEFDSDTETLNNLCASHQLKLSSLSKALRDRIGDSHKLDDVLGSLIHMLVNRIFMSSPRQHELVIYDYLRRIYLRKLTEITSKPTYGEALNINI